MIWVSNFVLRGWNCITRISHMTILKAKRAGCSLQHRTHLVHQETFLKIYLLPVNEPTASRSRNVRTRSLTATHGEPVSLNTRMCVARVDETNDDTRSLAVLYTKICKECFNWESSLSGRRSLSRKIVWLSYISIKSLILLHFSVG